MKFLFYLPLFCLLSVFSDAQSQVIENVLRYNTTDLKAIMDGEEVKGYYFFYQINKPGAKENLYMLNVYDEKLNELNSKGFKFTLKQKFLRLEHNGTGFCLQLFNQSGSLYEYVFLDEQLKESGKYSQKAPVDVTYNAALQMQYNMVVPLPESNFGIYGMNPQLKKWEFRSYSNKGEEIWKQNSGNSDKWKAENIVLLGGTSKNVSLFETYTKYEKKKNVSKHFLRVLDHQTGVELFKTEILTEHSVTFTTFLEIEGGYLLTGNYTRKQSAFLKEDVFMSFDKQGKAENESYLSLADDALKMREGQENRKIFQNRVVSIQQVREIGQSFFVIADLYDRNEISSATKRPSDLVVFELDKKLKLKDFYLLENTGSSLTKNRFIYARKAGSESSFVLVFDRELERNSDDIIIGFATYNRNKIRPGDVKMFPGVPKYDVLPASKDKILFFEYYEKEKKAILRLEKF